MATTYGMGQYRIKQGEDYITLLGESISSEHKIITKNGYNYQDIYFNLNNIDEGNGIRYGETYFLELTLPRHVHYDTNINIKICGSDGTGEIDTENQFQNIKQIIVPNFSANSGINYYQDVLLYEREINNNKEINVGIITTQNSDNTIGHIYYNGGKYFLIDSEGRIELSSYQSSKILKSWNIQNETETTITYKIVFSPKFDNVTYKYLYLEIDRSKNVDIEYIGNDNNTYKGIYIENADLNIYKVTNILSSGYIGHNSLNHIGVWGHPEMYLAINGEQIQIGKTGFYELDNFNITSLGVIVKDSNIDRFSIDYEFESQS